MLIDDIKRSRYLCFEDKNCLLSRMIYTYQDIEQIDESDAQIFYKLSVTDYMEQPLDLKLIYDKNSKRWRANLTESNLYELYQISNNIAEILKNGDHIVYRLPDREDRFKVLVKIYTHNHIVCYCNGNNQHGNNLKTMLSRWDEKYIVGIYTYDQRRQLRA